MDYLCDHHSPLRRRDALGAVAGLALCGAFGLTPKAFAQSTAGDTPKLASGGSVERIYVLNCGEARVGDRSIYSPGVHVGEPASLSCNAYLIKRHDGWTIWDTGLDDGLAAIPDGKVIAHGIRGVAGRTLASQLEEIGVAPQDVGTIILSHAHFDHVGNCRLFPNAKWVVQKAEYDAMFGPDYETFGFIPALYETMRRNPTEIVTGDHDVFGDGSVRLMSTPGHTPGHCSLLVRLPRRGPVILSGDVAHFAENFAHRRVPSFNADADQSRASMAKVADLVRREKASLWINHDARQSATTPHAPRWIE